MSRSRQTNNSESDNSSTKRWLKFGLVNILTPLLATGITFPSRLYQSKKQNINTDINSHDLPIWATIVTNYKWVISNFSSSLKASYTRSTALGASPHVQRGVEKSFEAKEFESREIAEQESTVHEELRQKRAYNRVMATVVSGFLVAFPEVLFTGPWTNKAVWSSNEFLRIKALKLDPKKFNLDPKLGWGGMWQLGKIGFMLRYTMSASNAICLLTFPEVKYRLDKFIPVFKIEGSNQWTNGFNAVAANFNYLLAATLNSTLFGIIRSPLSAFHKTLVGNAKIAEDTVTRRSRIVEMPHYMQAWNQFRTMPNKARYWRGVMTAGVLQVRSLLPLYILVDQLPGIVDRLVDKYYPDERPVVPSSVIEQTIAAPVQAPVAEKAATNQGAAKTEKPAPVPNHAAFYQPAARSQGQAIDSETQSQRPANPADQLRKPKV